MRSTTPSGSRSSRRTREPAVQDVGDTGDDEVARAGELAGRAPRPGDVPTRASTPLYRVGEWAYVETDSGLVCLPLPECHSFTAM